MNLDPTYTGLVGFVLVIGIAGFALYSRWRRQHATFVAGYPGIRSTISPVLDHPGLMCIKIDIVNNFEMNEVELTEVEIESPHGYRAFSPMPPKKFNVPFGEGASLIAFHRTLGRTNSSRLDPNHILESTANVRFYAYSDTTPLPLELHLSLRFRIPEYRGFYSPPIVIKQTLRPIIN